MFTAFHVTVTDIQRMISIPIGGVKRVKPVGTLSTVWFSWQTILADPSIPSVKKWTQSLSTEIPTATTAGDGNGSRYRTRILHAEH